MHWVTDLMHTIGQGLHPQYETFGEAAQAFWMPQAYASEQNVKQTMLTNTQNRMNIEYQNQQNLEQWNRENAYNSPSNQISMMRNAGLNPGLMYGGSGAIATSAPSPTMQGAHDVAPQLAGYDSPLSSILGLRSALAQVENVEAQTKATEDANKRANELQSGEVQKQSEEIKTMQKQLQVMQSTLDSMSLQQQRDSLAYLHESLRYQLDNSTFNDAVMDVKEGLRSKRLGNKFTETQISRALSLLPLEISGYRLSNSKLRSAINLDVQSYDQSKELFEYVKDIKINERDISRADLTLRELQACVYAFEHPDEFETMYPSRASLLGNPFNNFLLKSLERTSKVLGAFGSFLPKIGK